MIQREWFYPCNLIGYARFALLIGFFVLQDPLSKLVAIAASRLLDVIDGRVAAAMNQRTLFGSRLDLAADVSALAVMSFYVAYLNPNIILQILFVLCGLNDIVSNGLSVHLFYRNEKEKIDHKKVLVKLGILLPLYYSKAGLAVSNILNDAFLLLTIYSSFAYVPQQLLYICFAGYLFRHLSHLDQTVQLSKLALASQKTI